MPKTASLLMLRRKCNTCTNVLVPLQAGITQIEMEGSRHRDGEKSRKICLLKEFLGIVEFIP